MGPIGARLELMVSDKVGFGIDANYANTSVKWYEKTTDRQGNNVTYYYKFSIPRMRLMVAFNFHFGQSEKFDGYWKLAAGYSSLNWTYETNDPNYSDENVSFNLFPIAIRTAVGGRYFFTNNLGANVELGLGGGPLMTFGLCSKF